MSGLTDQTDVVHKLVEVKGTGRGWTVSGKV